MNHKLAVLPLLALLTSVKSFAFEATQIVYVNGQQINQMGASPTVQVRPGDILNLTAFSMYVDDRTGFIQQYFTPYPQQLTWRSSIDGSQCFAEMDCTFSGGFIANGNSVQYTVPYQMAASGQITVINRNTGYQHSVNLVNQYTGNPGGGYYPPQPQQPPQYGEIFPDANRYPSGVDFDFDTALYGQGSWTTVAGVRAFIPRVSIQNWQPYQHGYWFWSAQGWTWQSYDSWGWVTDHYGYWRHHRQYGWIWIAFTGPELRWRPATVTFFNNGGYVGWSPFYNEYSRGYVHGYNEGYDDGFWDGVNAGRQSTYQWGWTAVSYQNFTNRNVYSVCVRDRGVVTNIYGEAYRGGQYGNRAVVYGNRSDARVIIERHVGAPVRTIDVDFTDRGVRGGGRVAIGRPREQYDRPADYNRHIDEANRRVRENPSRPVTPDPRGRGPVTAPPSGGRYDGGRPGDDGRRGGSDGRGGYPQQPQQPQPQPQQPVRRDPVQQPPQRQPDYGRGGDDGRRGGDGRGGYVPQPQQPQPDYGRGGRGGDGRSGYPQQPQQPQQPVRRDPVQQPQPQPQPDYGRGGRGGDDGRRGGGGGYAPAPQQPRQPGGPSHGPGGPGGGRPPVGRGGRP